MAKDTNAETVECLFPAFLNIAGRPCVVVGGGQVACRKAEGLLVCGARVTVVSPRARKQIHTWHAAGLVTWRQKRFSPDDISGAVLVFAATDDGRENRRVVAACKKQNIFVNAAEDPEQGDFFIPAILRMRALCIAVSTGGKSPLLARRVCRELEGAVAAEYADFLDILGNLRDRLKQEVPDRTRRKRILEQIVQSDILDLLKAGKQDHIQERIEQCILSLQD